MRGVGGEEDQLGIALGEQQLDFVRFLHHLAQVIVQAHAETQFAGHQAGARVAVGQVVEDRKDIGARRKT